MPRHPLILVPCIAALALGACASAPDSGRPRLTAPREITALHSEVTIQAQLALKPDRQCRDEACTAAEDFRRQVEQLGGRLSGAAVQLADDLRLDGPRSEVTVSDKEDIGTLSTASGRVIVFAGLRDLALPEAALAFLVAREMGHVLAGHHEENSSTSIAVSLAIAMLFPLAGVLQGIETTYTATTLASSLTSTAASFAGSRILQEQYREEQRREADALALRILARAGWSPQEVADALQAAEARLDREGWMAELRSSQQWLARITAKPPSLPEEEYPEESVDPASLAVAWIPHDRFGPDRRDRPYAALWLLRAPQVDASGERFCRPGLLTFAHRVATVPRPPQKSATGKIAVKKKAATGRAKPIQRRKPGGRRF